MSNLHVDDPKESRTHLYSILNLSPEASIADIQRSYKLLSKSFHPDKVFNSTSFEDESSQANTYYIASASAVARNVFDHVKLAHDVLSDPLLRFCYDNAGMHAVILIRRAQQQHDAAMEQELEHSHGRKDEDSEDDSDDEPDLLEQLKRDYAKDPCRARQTLTRLLVEQKFATSRDSQSMDVSMNIPLMFAPADGHLLSVSPIIIDDHDATAHLQFTTRHAVTTQCQASCTTLCQVEPSAQTKWQTLLTCDTTMSQATQVSATVGLSPQYDHPSKGTAPSMSRSSLQSSPIQVALRTSRTMASGTLAMIALQTSLAQQPLIRNGSSNDSARADSGEAATERKSSSSQSSEVLPTRIRPVSTIISLTSVRNVSCDANLFGRKRPSHSQDNFGSRSRVQACWKLGFQPLWQSSTSALRCRLAQVMISLQTLQFPQYRMQLSTNGGGGGLPMVKIKYSSDANHGLRGSFASNELFGGLLGEGVEESAYHLYSHWKITWLTKPLSIIKSLSPMQNHNQHSWQLQFGLKYHGLSKQWTVVSHLHGSIWNIKVPIICGAIAEAPVLIMASLLLGQALDHFLLIPLQKNFSRPHRVDSKQNTEPGTMLGFRVDNPYLVEMVQVTAQKKRDYESSVDGLVILLVKCTDQVLSALPLIDLLQFWVVDGRLELQPCWFSHLLKMQRSDEIHNLRWTQRVLLAFNRRTHESCHEEVKFTIRYYFQGRVYETSTASGIILPSPEASCLGTKGSVT